MSDPSLIPGHLPTSAAEARLQVVQGSRIVGTLGEDLTLGHVSVRCRDSNTMYIKRKGVAGSEIAVEDVFEVQLDDPDCLKVPGMHLEAVIHTEIYRRRPDVGSVIHGHPLYSTALSATDVTLEFLTHDSVLFKDGIGSYDTADLVTTKSNGAAVAESLGNRRATLLRNHGVVFAGEDIRFAVLAAVTLERAIQMQLVARGLGAMTPLSEDKVRALYKRKYQDRFLDEYWGWWLRQVGQEADGPMQAASSNGKGVGE